MTPTKRSLRMRLATQQEIASFSDQILQNTRECFFIFSLNSLTPSEWESHLLINHPWVLEGFCENQRYEEDPEQELWKRKVKRTKRFN